jgi:hypothetical protein|tara:strand:+ start:41 stop:346 length:306 start_codon:yes stop_codon:yes gene_type:complete
MFIKRFNRDVFNYSVPYGSRPSKKVTYTLNGCRDDFGNLIKSLKGLKNKFVHLKIEKNPNDIFWSLFEFNMLGDKEEKFVAKFLKLNEAKAFLKNNYKVAQ